MHGRVRITHRPLLVIASAIVAWTVSGDIVAFAQQRQGRVPARRAGQAAKAQGANPSPSNAKGTTLPRITPQEQARVDALLRRWAAHSGDVKTLRGRFGRITYNATFKTTTKDTGSFVYKAPDKGKFWVDRKGDPEKWICNGKVVLQFNDETKQVKRIQLPPELQGVHIRKGPMPFLFGMSADELRRRYWLRITKEPPGQVWLEAYPLHRDDAANFRMAQLILDTETFLPQAIKLHDPNGKSSRVYNVFDLKRNGFIRPGVFNPPLFGWKIISIPLNSPGPAVPMPRITPPNSKSAKPLQPKRSSLRK